MPETSQDPKLAQLVDDLKSELDEVYRANERTAAAMDQAVKERDKLAEDYEVLGDKLEVLESEVNAASSQREQQLNSQIDSLQTEVAQQRATIDQLATERDKLSTQIQTIESDRQEAVLQNERLVGQLAESKRALNDFQNQAAALETEHGAEIAALKKALDQLGRDRELSLASSKRVAESLETQLKQLREELLETKSECAEREFQRDQLQRELVRSANELRQTETLVTGFVDATERAGHQLKEQAAELEQSRRLSSRSQDQLTARIEQLDSEVGALREQVVETESKLERERVVNVEFAKLLANRSRNEADQQTEAIKPIEVVDLQDEALAPHPPKSTGKSKPKTKRKRTAKRAKDDLTVIEGIGTKIRDLLVSKRIATFKKLAATDPARLERILTGAGFSLKRYDPTAWPEEAKLAADGKMDRLKELQRNRATSWVSNCVRPVH